MQKINELDPYRKYSQLTQRILKTNLDEKPDKQINLYNYNDDKSCPGDRSRENFLAYFN